MTLGPGGRLGPYEILAPLGAGGMLWATMGRPVSLGLCQVPARRGGLSRRLRMLHRVERNGARCGAACRQHRAVAAWTATALDVHRYGSCEKRALSMAHTCRIPDVE